MIVVTGGAGFIGSNIVKGFNQRGRTDILVVDNLTNGIKFKNLVDCEIADYLDKESFLKKMTTGEEFTRSIEAIFHMGACSTTTEWDGRYMMNNNYEYSKILLAYCMERGIPFIYASSAATYGNGTVFKEAREYEAPLNVYGYSKLQFDDYVRRILLTAKSKIIGLRYFNVYGPRESHKGAMASVAFHFNNQIIKDGFVKLFQGTDGYGDGEQQRDFVYVEDVVAVNLWFLDHQAQSGIYNVGSGRAESFNAVARAVINWHDKGSIEYIPFPEHLKGHYQSFTQADISKLRSVQCDVPFHTVAEGVKKYLDWMEGVRTQQIHQTSSVYRRVD